MKPSEILRAGLNLLETKGWTQHDYAKDAKGDTVFNVEQAVCFCSMGAVRVAASGTLRVPNDNNGFDEYKKAREALEATIGLTMTDNAGFAKWQDVPTRTLAEVKAKFLLAIELAEQQEQAV